MTEYDNDLLTPVGRFVAGSFTKPETKDYHGNDLIIKTGVDQGKPGVRFWAHIAFQKGNNEFNQLYQKIQTIGKAGFPELFQGGQYAGDFSWKLLDGDSTIPNKKGTVISQKEGYSGHFILNFTTSFAPKLYDMEAVEIDDNKEYIKLGDYIRIMGSVSPNKNLNNPGVYLNMSKVQHVAYGKRIVMSSGEPFKKAPTENLPVGASLTPQQPPSNLNGSSVPNAIGIQPTPNIQPAKAPPMPPTDTNIAPANDILDKPIMKKYILDGNQWTETDLKASGWTDQQINSLQVA